VATFFELQEKNRRKTRIVVAGFILFFIWLGLGLDLSLYYLKGSKVSRGKVGASVAAMSSVQAPERKTLYPIFTVILGIGSAVAASRRTSNAGERVMKAMLARPAQKERGGMEQMLVNVVEEMCIASGIGLLRIWIIPDEDPNALATGMKDGDYHIAVTAGLLNTLTRDELQGVIGHEIAHLKNGDTRLMTCLTVLVGIATLITEFVSRVRFFRSDRSYHSGSSGGVSLGDADSDDIRIGAVIFALWLIAVLIAPIVSQLMMMMVSREREYLADASSAQFTRNPGALARALQKIADADGPTRLVRPASAMLCIASPAAADLDMTEGWFATHPPIKKRIARLKSISTANSFANTIRQTK